MLNFLKRLWGDENTATIKEILPIVAQVNEKGAVFSVLSDIELKDYTRILKEKLAKEGSRDFASALDGVLPEGFAMVREAARRTLGQRHFDVQILGGVAMHRGKIAEMRTGEGKTLVATLPAYLNALSGKGVHVVTVNDYLSRRDAVWMGQIYHFLGLSVGCITSDGSYLYDPKHTEKYETLNPKSETISKSEILNSGFSNLDIRASDLDRERDTLGSFKVVHEFLRPCSRKEAYSADITYGTNNEFGFDYLRDNLARSLEGMSQREFNFAIVDEIDSILIDESRTPLIISAPSVESEDLYKTFASIAQKLEQEKDYTLDEKMRAVTLTDAGIEKTEKILNIGNIYTEKGIKYVHHLETAVRAKALFLKDREYVVQGGAVAIVDPFTGRIMPGRRWSEGLHQAIEAKEGVAIQKESRTMATITFQNYFRMYKKLSGMTGTAQTSSEEFYKVYGLDVVAVPTNQSVARVDQNDLIFQTEKGKFAAVSREVKELHKKGQPVLIGTVSIEKNEMLSEFLRKEGVPHTLLNAKNHEREGEIIAQAGKKKAVTIATNMAGRGVDIKLGGNPATKEEYEEVKKLGGLYVLGTERHEARRIDNQLRGRSGRQGDPGETRFFVSLEDSLMRVFASDVIKKMMGRFGIPEDQPIENYLITRSLESAQTKIEGVHFDSRKHILEFDNVLNHQRKSVYEKRRRLLTGGKDEILRELFVISDTLGGTAKEEIEKKQSELGEEVFVSAVRQLCLSSIDMLWVEHLETMDYLRGSVNLRAYGQRDPLVEYKREGLRLFREMEEAYSEQVMKTIPLIAEKEDGRAIVGPRETTLRLIESHKNSQNFSSNQNHPSKKEPGRNDLCPCGSGKKYKKCHMTQG
ncbi:MAG: preprotein translocase subunit SecA [bacterium]|nr:preprotein translocase subunit SecA [bacterium]